ncbi:hypothetical protein ACIGW0_00550 [Streptomyces bikiniensis]|uniref:Secreted protein n=1 Tax=Streptomyces bikiniensis TaxID=1896 RepID=A0ABW8CK31_STRBI
MTLTPVALALISTGAGLVGAVIGTAGTLISASLTQRATRNRESDFKVWERRADAIEEAHRKMLALANARDLAWARRALPTGLDPADLDPGHQDEQSRLVATKLSLYTTPDLVRAHRKSNDEFLKSLLAILGVQLALSETGAESDRARRERRLNEAVAEATSAVEKSKAADERLEAALREAAAIAAPRRRRR